MNVYTLYAVKPASGLFDQIENQNINPGIEEVIKHGDGGIDPKFVAMMNAKPMFGFTTTGIAKALALCGINGLAISAACDFYLQKMEDLGTRAAGANHIKLSASRGLIVPKTLKVSQDKEATIEYEAYLASLDGTTSPFSISTGQALAGSPTTNQLYTLGPATFNGAAWAGVQDLSVDFGLEVYVKAGDGTPFPTFVCIRKRTPKVTLKGLDPVLMSTLTVNGAAIASTTSVKLKGLAQDGVRSGSDITLAIGAGRVHVGTISGGEEEQGVDVTITPRTNGVNDIIAISGI